MGTCCSDSCTRNLYGFAKTFCREVKVVSSQRVAISAGLNYETGTKMTSIFNVASCTQGVPRVTT